MASPRPNVPRARVGGRLWGTWALVWALATAASLRLHGEQSATEYEVKAAYVFNFVSFITWPSAAFTTSTSPLVVCLAGPSPIEDPLGRVTRGENVKGRPLEVRRLARPNDVAGCHVLFSDAGTPTTAEAKTAPLLTIGEANDFLEAGGMIRLLVTPDRKVGFEVNVKAASLAGLQLNARLLKVARRVVGPAATGGPRP